MKIGDKVVCIDDEYTSLVLYNTYKIFRIKYMAFDLVIINILNADGIKTYYDSKKFKLLENHRTDIINDILK